ncbi:MAG: N-acetyl sugar amidotransferase [Deltaproteobacteria bacterium]|nr:N-acetyl sugar amidotransferase [Deltaproteobacteria bacterium]
MESKYGAPAEVKFCKRCVMPNQRPSSSNEWAHTAGSRHKFIHFDEEGVCSACRFAEAKDQKIDWQEREKELLNLLSRYRSKDGSYDCLVPGSGGKDSCYASHLLKYKYGMHPLTVTWAPHLYTDVGWNNHQNWVHVGGFDNYLFTPNGRIHQLLTRNAVLNLLHPFQPFILGQKTFATKMAVKFNLPLVFYGEAPGEYGANVSIHQKKFSTGETTTGKDQDEGFRLDFTRGRSGENIYLGGKSVSEYLREGTTLGDLDPYLPLDPQIAQSKNLEFHYLGYYIKWIPQEAYYYAVEHTGFQANPVRTEGTYSKYNSIDDKTDGYFYYTTYMKFGYGRATQDAAQEIRNKHLTREEGVALVRRYDGEFPERYYKEFLEYISMTDTEFKALCDKFRSPHLWEQTKEGWRLRHVVS